ncbi:MAG TPA: hypothetical protein VK933_03365 [Longimicrobiales bacterium]|nr:hypothetical protein [Longimicrobiales bacterium]
MGLLSKLIGRTQPADNPYEGLRQQVLRVKPSNIGLQISAEAPIFGVVMETGMGRDVATFLCMTDGTVSLYLSTGGGVIGAGQHEAVRAASDEMLRLTNEYAAAYLEACGQHPGRSPKNGMVHFHLLTSDGPHTAECRESDLQTQQDPFSNLYSNCHQVMAEVREAESARS